MDAGLQNPRVPPHWQAAHDGCLNGNYWQNALQVEHYIAFAETVTELKGRLWASAISETNRGLEAVVDATMRKRKPWMVGRWRYPPGFKAPAFCLYLLAQGGVRNRRLARHDSIFSA